MFHTGFTLGAYRQQPWQVLHHIALRSKEDQILICYSGTGNSPFLGTNMHCVEKCRVAPLAKAVFHSMHNVINSVSFSNMFTVFSRQYRKGFQAITAFTSRLLLALLLRETAETLTVHKNGQWSSADLRQQWTKKPFKSTCIPPLYWYVQARTVGLFGW